MPEQKEKQHDKVRRHGKVHELPSEVRREVDALLTEPGTTYEDVALFLKNKGHEIGKSSIGRYGKDFLSTYQRLRIVEDQSRALISEAGDGLILDEAGGKLMAQKMIEVLMKDKVKDKDLPYFADGISRLIKANVSREKFKSEFEKKVNKATDDVAKIVKAKGLGKDSIELIKKKIQGIKV
jgi:Protein of unknown function (DUF3486)